MNPWLEIPLADYEAHMAMADVGQSSLLSDAFGNALRKYLPGSVAVLGCAGGNGFDHILPNPRTSVVGIDINPAYIAETGKRYQALLPGLQLIVGDIEKTCFSFQPAELVFAGLVFEYVDVERALRNIRKMLCANGVLVVVLQLPLTDCEPVTPSPYVSLKSLNGHMSLVRPNLFTAMAIKAGFRANETEVQKACGGKEFLVMHLHRVPTTRSKHPARLCGAPEFCRSVTDSSTSHTESSKPWLTTAFLFSS